MERYFEGNFNAVSNLGMSSNNDFKLINSLLSNNFQTANASKAV